MLACARPGSATLALVFGLAALAGAVSVPPSDPLVAQEADPTPPGIAGGRVAGVTLAVEIDETGASVATLETRLEMEGGVASIPLRGLAFGGSAPTAVTARFEAVDATVEWSETRPPLILGRVAVPVGARGSADAGTRTVTMRYEIPAGRSAAAGGAGSGGAGSHVIDVRIPVIFVDWAPRDSPERFFTARVTLPPGTSIVERFPTVPISAVAGGGARVYEFALPAAPSMLRLRIASGSGGPTFAARVDAAVIAGLLLIGLLAWRRFRAASRA